MIKKRHLMVLSVIAVSALLGSLFYGSITFSKEEIPTPVDVVNLPVDEEGNLKVKLVDNELWQVVNDLQSKVDSLNASLAGLEDRVAELESTSQSPPRILTVHAYPNWMLCFDGVWTDLLSIPDVEIPEGSSVFAVASFNVKCSEVRSAPIDFRYRANDTYGTQTLAQGSPAGNVLEIVGFHYVWGDLAVGTYTFAIQYNVYPTRTVYVADVRLTLIIC